MICNIPPIKTGTDFDGLEFWLPEEEVLSLAYATAKIQFRTSPGAPVAQEFRPGNGSLVIELPNKIIWPQQKITAKPGIYQWDLKIQFIDRTEIPFGGRITVLPYITSI